MMNHNRRSEDSRIVHIEQQIAAIAKASEEWRKLQHDQHRDNLTHIETIDSEIVDIKQQIACGAESIEENTRLTIETLNGTMFVVNAMKSGKKIVDFCCAMVDFFVRVGRFLKKIALPFLYIAGALYFVHALWVGEGVAGAVAAFWRFIGAK